MKIVAVLVLLSLATVFATNGVFNGNLLVNDFPHYQPFDRWDTCQYPGTCYEQSCPNPPDGWQAGPFHGGPGSNDGRDDRHWWVQDIQPSSNKFNLGSPNQGQLLACPNLLTGPCFDHTQGDSSGRYLLAEASACYQSFFNIYSPYIAYSSTGATISFWYYMYGAAMDAATSGNAATLTVFILTANDTASQQVVKFTGQQQAVGDPWKQSVTNVDGFLGGTPTSSNPIVVRFLFQAVAGGQRNNGDWWQGDLALDDVIFTQNNASNVTTPYVPPPPVNTTAPTAPPSVGPPPVTVGSGDGLSTGAIVGIVVGVVGGMCCLLCLLLLLVLLILLIVSPRKPPQGKGGDGM